MDEQVWYWRPDFNQVTGCWSMRAKLYFGQSSLRDMWLRIFGWRKYPGKLVPEWQPFSASEQQK